MATVLKSLQRGLHAIMAANPRAIVLGEDVLDPYGGAFKVTAGLSTAYPDRVLTTPIAEAAITGVASGLALRGYSPIVEIMFGDFLTLTADQIVNHATKFSRMYGGVHCPMILRTPMGGGRGYGPTHSQSIEKMFLGIPGLTIVASSHFHDPGATLQRIAATASEPVVFIEHKLLYSEPLRQSTPELPVSRIEDESAFGTVVVRNYDDGEPDVGLVTYGGMARALPKLLAALADEEIRVKAVLPECIDPLPVETIVRGLDGCRRIVIAEEGYAGFNWGSGVASELYPRLWGRLDGPIRLVASDCAIIPTSFEQEAEMLAGPARMEAAIMAALTWRA